MGGVLAAIAIFLAAPAPTGADADPRTASFESGGVRIDVTVHSQVFAWTVTNVSAGPIVRFEVGNHNTYNHDPPEGWSATFVDDLLAFEAEGIYRAIQPGDAARFTTRVGSNGASLGLVPARLRVFGADESIEFQGVWGAVPQPMGIGALVAALLVAIGVAHAWWSGRRDGPRRAARHGTG
jgi:hypothetical protein